MTVFKDICTGRRYTKNGEEKTAWTRVGVLIEKDGRQYVKLEAYPLPNAEGEVFLSVFEPKPREQQGQQRSAPRDDLDSDIPF